MKIKFITFFFSLLSALANAQNSEHLSFKGVPINGTLNEYIIKMKQNGFRHIQTKDGTAFLKGDFAGYKDCYIGVSTLTKKNLVSKITVSFSEQNSWSLLSSNYFNLKEMLTEKYGQPFEIVEKFSTYEPNDDGSKMILVNLDACKYVTTYETDKGRIELSIKGGNSGALVLLSYFDKINGAIINATAKDDL
jgi:hypothetical protein